MTDLRCFAGNYFCTWLPIYRLFVSESNGNDEHNALIVLWLWYWPPKHYYSGCYSWFTVECTALNGNCGLDVVFDRSLRSTDKRIRLRSCIWRTWSRRTLSTRRVNCGCPSCGWRGEWTVGRRVGVEWITKSIFGLLVKLSYQETFKAIYVSFKFHTFMFHKKIITYR